MVVAGGGDGETQQILIVVNSLYNGAEEQQKLCVLIGGLAGGEEVYSRIRGQRPVVVLARAVDSGERLLVEQADKPMLRGNLLHYLHGQLVVVGGDVCCGVDGCQLMLRGRNLVVLGLCENAELPELLVEVGHVCRDSRLDNSEIVVVHLLTLGRLCAEERASAENQILALFIERLVNEEIFLLGADGGAHAFYVGVAEKSEYAQSLLVECLHGTEQGRFLVERLAAVGAERRGDAESFVFYKCVGGGIPRGVAAGFKGCSESAGGEGRCVRLAFYQLLARELHDNAPVGGGGNEAVVLLGGYAGQGLEPVGKMGRAALNGPVLHRGGNCVGDVIIETRSFVNGLLERLVNIGGKHGFHHSVVKNETSEIVGYCAHKLALLFHILRRKTKNGVNEPTGSKTPLPLCAELYARRKGLSRSFRRFFQFCANSRNEGFLKNKIMSKLQPPF